MKTVSFFVIKSLMIKSPPTFYQIFIEFQLKISILLSTISLIGIITFIFFDDKTTDMLFIDSITPSKLADLILSPTCKFFLE